MVVVALQLSATAQTGQPVCDPFDPAASRSQQRIPVAVNRVHEVFLPTPPPGLVTEIPTNDSNTWVTLEMTPILGRNQRTAAPVPNSIAGGPECQVQLAAQCNMQGSAQANTWLHALGQELPEEIIILPGEGPKSMVQRNANTIAWETGIALEVFPNPSSGPVFAVVEVPEEVEQAEIRLADVHGRILQVRRLSGGPGFITLKTESLAPGLYMAEVRLDGHRVAQAKVIIQR